MKKINILPIKWFGNRTAFEKSPIRIITVGLNPSDKEFRKTGKDALSSKLRFPSFDGTDASLIIALNEYFDKNPYQWFSSFEYILNGLDASYYSNKDRSNIALHTDLCCNWATIPTWSRLNPKEKKVLMKDGFSEWKALVQELKPHIILFSVPKEYIEMLEMDKELTELTRFNKTKDGKSRKTPIVIQQYEYANAIAIFGRTWNYPFGGLGKEQKTELGILIKTLL